MCSHRPLLALRERSAPDHGEDLHPLPESEYVYPPQCQVASSSSEHLNRRASARTRQPVRTRTGGMPPAADLSPQEPPRTWRSPNLNRPVPPEREFRPNPWRKYPTIWRHRNVSVGRCPALGGISPQAIRLWPRPGPGPSAWIALQ